MIRGSELEVVGSARGSCRITVSMRVVRRGDGEVLRGIHTVAMEPV
jgi:hypothetical protein